MAWKKDRRLVADVPSTTETREDGGTGIDVWVGVGVGVCVRVGLGVYPLVRASRFEPLIFVCTS